jgi:hypothetical protein
MLFGSTCMTWDMFPCNLHPRADIKLQEDPKFYTELPKQKKKQSSPWQPHLAGVGVIATSAGAWSRSCGGGAWSWLWKSREEVSVAALVSELERRRWVNRSCRWGGARAQVMANRAEEELERVGPRGISGASGRGGSRVRRVEAELRRVGPWLVDLAGGASSPWRSLAALG